MFSSNLVFHIGLHKTGTTFLQSKIFPNVAGIDYMVWRNLEYFLRLDETRRYLISCEGLSGYTFASREAREKSIRSLGEMFPDARIIIVFRPHGDFVSSLYSQYIRYGGTLPIEKFFQIPGDPHGTVESGPIIDAGSIDYQMIIQDIENNFRIPPMVVIMGDIFKNPKAFLDDFCTYASCQYEECILAKFQEKPVNTSLKRWHGKMLLRINKILGGRVSLDGRNRPFPRLRRLGFGPAEIFLDKLDFIPSGPLVGRDVKDRINQHFSDQWRDICDYAAARKWQNI
jgi:hypothetical protein